MKLVVNPIPKRNQPRSRANAVGVFALGDLFKGRVKDAQVKRPSAGDLLRTRHPASFERAICALYSSAEMRRDRIGTPHDSIEGRRSVFSLVGHGETPYSDDISLPNRLRST